jgi:hypothetical protein
MDIEENESWATLEIYRVPLIRYMRNGTEGLPKKGEEVDAENISIVIPTQVRWLVNHRTTRERRQN